MGRSSDVSILEPSQLLHIRRVLKRALKEVRSLNSALGFFFSDDIIQSILSLPKGENLLLEALIALIRVEIKYIYPIKSLESALRIYFCYFNRNWFGEYYLGSEYASCQAKWRQNWDRKRHFQAAPRDHGKSHIYSLELPLWKICYVDNIRILMASKTDTLAEKYLGAIKRTIETNWRIKEDFGDLASSVNPVDGSKLDGGKGKGGWSKRVLFCRRTNHSLKDGTLESIGWGSSITGSRFDLIILDDPIEESDCRTVKARKRQQGMLHTLEELLEPDGQFLVIGTRKHYGDLYAYILENPRWTHTVDKGIIKYPEYYEYVYEKDPDTGKDVIVDVYIPEGEEYEVLWEEKWDIKQLLIKKAGSLPTTFMREIQNEVNSDETSDFKKEWIEANRDIVQLGRPMPYYDSRPEWAIAVVVGVDLSGIFDKVEAEERDGDYTVMPVLALDKQFNRHLIYMYRKRGLDVEDQLNQMVEINYKFQPDFFVLETNQYQKTLHSLSLKKKLPVYPHTTGGEKHGIEYGLPRLALELKSKYFVFYTGGSQEKINYDTLFAEFHGFGVETHDDIVMGIWLADLGANWVIQKIQKRKMRESKRRNRKIREVTQEAQAEAKETKIRIDYQTTPEYIRKAKAMLDKYSK